MLTEAHVTRLEKRYAIPPDKSLAFADSGIIRSVTPEEIARILAKEHLEGGGILIRYPSKEMFTIRLDVPRHRPNGKKQKYDRPAGVPPCLFTPPGVDLEKMGEIWVTEGEMKALAGIAHGLPVCALAGVYNWRQDVGEDDPELAAAKMAAGGKAPDPEALISDLRRDWTGKTFVLIYDSDITQEHPAWPAFGRLAEQLYALGAAEVKVLSLPAVPPLEGEDDGKDKTGLDDYIRRRKARGHDPAAELRELVRRAPVWVPSAGVLFDCMERVGTLDGLERFAQSRLTSGDLTQMVIGAAAYYLGSRETLLHAALKSAGVRGEMAQAVKRDAQAEAERVLARQEWRWRPEEEKKEDSTSSSKRTITEAFPPAKMVLPEGFPFPPCDRKRTFYDIRGSKIVEVTVDDDREKESVIVETVVLLTRRLAPLEEGGDERWEVAWWEKGRWRKAQLPSDWLFDVGQRKWLIRAGVPASSATAEKLVGWLHALRCQAVFNNTPLSTAKTVDRCGWHQDGAVFVFGQEILTAQDRREEADSAGATAEGQDKEEEILWADDTSVLERQILASFGVGGDPEKHKEFLLEMITKYPQAAFGVGCACAAPLITLLREAPGAKRLDVSGFTVMMGAAKGQGRSRHQGKTCWNRIVAGLYGWPEKDPKGRLRFADRTRVALGVLYGASCDLPVHIEDIHLFIQERKKEAAAELDWLLQLTAGGMDRERGAKGGGGRRTRYFRTVAFWTSETDLTDKIPPGSGSIDRILKLPPLLAEESDENREEAERIERETLTNYGHVGREYLFYILHHLLKNRDEFLNKLGNRFDSAVSKLRETLPTDTTARHIAGRLTKRVALGMVGLSFLLEALEVKDEVAIVVMKSFARGWDMVMDGLPEANLAGRALEAVQTYVAGNKESILGLRMDEKPPAKWAGSLAEVTDQNNTKVQVVALLETAFSEAVQHDPFDLDPQQALEALVGAGKVVLKIEKRKDGKVTKRTKQKVSIGGAKAWCICIPVSLLIEDNGQEDQKKENETFQF